jgi:hypothetical protein
MNDQTLEAARFFRLPNTKRSNEPQKSHENE